jgi:adenine-specific DNA-methyltransferase
MARKKTTEAVAAKIASDAITSIKYPAKRKNIPPAGLEAHGVLQESPRLRYEYNPHLPPILRSATEATEADKLPKLLATARQRALSAAEAELLADALQRHQPWLEWSGKREKPWFEVDPVALHMHERISTQAILRVLAREDVERDLFADPQHDYAKAVQFYKHDMDWANRMILGDSLQVMASLARREGLAGRVQMIYLDPPYGIKFASNFQPQLGQREVKDREQDLTREPEMVKAYRDTWTLGIHSYLAYLRDRLAMARELLADAGSIFVQIGDENLHRVRCVLDEIFGQENFVTVIAFKKTAAQAGDKLPGTLDFLLHYAKSLPKMKYRQLYREKEVGGLGGGKYAFLQNASGFQEKLSDNLLNDLPASESLKLFAIDTLVSQRPPGDFPVDFQGGVYRPKRGYWKTGEDGLRRLVRADRVLRGGSILMYRRYFGDFPCFPLVNSWEDTSSGASASDPKIYVVQTNPKIIERCLLMTTDPGDLVLDPTCGSGTTAFVAEQWGRRWITCDSSRVALALAKHRLMTAKFDFHQLRELSAEDVERNPNGTWIAELDHEGKATGRKLTFKCKTVPHITLKSIARNSSLDPIFAKHEPMLAAKLDLLNREVTKVGAALKEKLVQKLVQKHREEGASAVTDADTRRWLLPHTPPALIKSIAARSGWSAVIRRL